MELTLENMLELLEDRIVPTSGGLYVSVEDLKRLQEEYKGMKSADEPTGKAKTLFAARKALHEDPEFLKQFGPKEPKAPADAAVVKPVAEERNDATQ